MHHVEDLTAPSFHFLENTGALYLLRSRSDENTIEVVSWGAGETKREPKHAGPSAGKITDFKGLLVRHVYFLLTFENHFSSDDKEDVYEELVCCRHVSGKRGGLGSPE
jgi:hypothetical protein